MLHLKQAVIVEGKYDKIKLSSMIDSLIITTDGFSIFKNKEKISLIKELAEKDGIIILTDSDSAGFKIRNYIKGCTSKGKIINIYIPEIFGKEKRKAESSKEGKLGVEGISVKILTEAFEKAGITVSDNEKKESLVFTRARLFDDCLIGRANSEEKRKKLLKELSLPSALSTTAILEVLNTMYTEDEYKQAIEKIR